MREPNEHDGGNGNKESGFTTYILDNIEAMALNDVICKGSNQRRMKTRMRLCERTKSHKYDGNSKAHYRLEDHATASIRTVEPNFTVGGHHFEMFANTNCREGKCIGSANDNFRRWKTNGAK